MAIRILARFHALVHDDAPISIVKAAGEAAAAAFENAMEHATRGSTAVAGTVRVSVTANDRTKRSGR